MCLLGVNNRLMAMNSSPKRTYHPDKFVRFKAHLYLNYRECALRGTKSLGQYYRPAGRSLAGCHCHGGQHVSRSRCRAELVLAAAAVNPPAFALPCPSAMHLTDLVRFACSPAPGPHRSGRCRLSARCRMGKTRLLQMPRCGEPLGTSLDQVKLAIEHSASVLVQTPRPSFARARSRR
jgi:hypothetical protein